MDAQPTHDPANAAPPAPPAGKPAPVPVVLPRYTPLILAPRRRASRNPAPLEPTWPTNTEYWAHWTYTDWEWLAAAKDDLDEARRNYEKTRRVLPSIIAAGVAVAVLLLILAWATNAPAVTIFIPLIGSVLCAFAWINAWSQYRWAKDQYRAVDEAPREVAIGPWWIWQNAEAKPLLRLPNSQLWVWLNSAAPMQLNFTIKEQLWYQRYSSTRYITVLVPQGHEAEAAQLVERFQREVIYNPTSANPPRQEPTPPPLFSPTYAPAITQHLPPLPPLPTEIDTQRFDGPRKAE